jgi:hypothetical protein
VLKGSLIVGRCSRTNATSSCRTILLRRRMKLFSSEKEEKSNPFLLSSPQRLRKKLAKAIDPWSLHTEDSATPNCRLQIGSTKTSRLRQWVFNPQSSISNRQLIHSYLNATIGSTWDAFLAGRYPASTATASMSVSAIRIVRGSGGKVAGWLRRRPSQSHLLRYFTGSGNITKRFQGPQERIFFP